MSAREQQLRERQQLGEQTTEDATRRLRELLPLLFLRRWDEWILRKLDSLVFLDAESIHRTLELEYRLPGDLVETARDLSVTHYPVALVDREVARSVRVRNEAEAKIPTLTERESAERAGDMLVGAAEEILDDDLPAALADQLRSIPLARSVAGRRSALARFFQGDRDEDEAALRLGVATNPRFGTLAATVVQYQVIFVADDSLGSQRRMITIDYEAAISRRGPRAALAPLRQVLGWRDTQLLVSAGDVGSAETTELRFAAPEGVELSDARAVVAAPGEEPEEYDVEIDPRHPRRYVTLVLPDVVAGTTGSLHVRMRPERGYPAAVALTALFAAAVLTVGALQLETIDESADAATTLLLAGPTVFAALIAQPGRGTPAARMLVAARGALILAGLWTFTAAAALVAFSYGNALRLIWTVLLCASWLTAAVLVVGLLSPWIGRSRRGPG